MIECVVNIAEGCDRTLIAAIARRAGATCLDVHSDLWHNRSVLTLAGPDTYEATIEVARATLELGVYHPDAGVHPSIGLLDVVPFVPLGPAGYGPAIDLTVAIADRDAFIEVVGKELALPCFAFGPERSLPEIRRHAFVDLAPDGGPELPHPTAGGACVGARPALIAYNVYLEQPDLAAARSIASGLRSPVVRALGFAVGAEVQVSCNLIAPWAFGPADAFDAVAARAAVSRAELVGLIPDAALRAVPPTRWTECDLSPEQTIEARLG